MTSEPANHVKSAEWTVIDSGIDASHEHFSA